MGWSKVAVFAVGMLLTFAGVTLGWLMGFDEGMDVAKVELHERTTQLDEMHDALKLCLKQGGEGDASDGGE